MSHDWPGDWHSKVNGKSDLPAGEQTGPSFTNDHGVRWLVSDTNEAWIRMHGDVPENRC